VASFLRVTSGVAALAMILVFVASFGVALAVVAVLVQFQLPPPPRLQPLRVHWLAVQQPGSQFSSVMLWVLYQCFPLVGHDVWVRARFQLLAASLVHLRLLDLPLPPPLDFLRSRSTFFIFPIYFLVGHCPHHGR
jgi:hypothetical protein